MSKEKIPVIPADETVEEIYKQGEDLHTPGEDLHTPGEVLDKVGQDLYPKDEE